MKIDWRQVIVGSMMGVVLVGCAANQKGTTEKKPDNQAKLADPDARNFAGTIISLRPMHTTMLISKDERQGKVAYPNIITVRYDADSKIFVDDKPATILDLMQYMPVKVEGHMREGQMFVETARFTSLPMPKEAPKSTAAGE